MTDFHQNKTFISYSHCDDDLKEELIKSLRAAPDFDNDFWDDSHIQAGQDWYKEIKAALEEANSVVLVASATFFDSDFIRNEELKPVLKKLEKKQSKTETGSASEVKLIIVPIGDGIIERMHEAGLDKYQAVVDLREPFGADADADDLERTAERIATEIFRAIDRTKTGLAERLSNENRPVEIIRTLNVGKRANLYEGKIRWKPERDVVIKTLGSQASAEARRNLDKELPENSAVTEASNVVPIYWSDLSADPAYYVMRKMDLSLDQYIEKHEQINWNVVQQFLLKIGAALRFAYSKGHLQKSSFDLRPSHILLDLSGEGADPYLSFSPRVRGKSKSRLIQLMGKKHITRQEKEKIAYFLPENVDPCVRAPDPGVSDMYLLGLMGMHMLTGRLPETTRLSEDTDGQPDIEFKSLEPISRDLPLPFSEWDEKHFLDVVLEKMAAAHPDRRFENLGDALEALRNPRRYVLGVVRASYERCRPRHEFIRHFYGQLFENYPEVSALFEHFDADGSGQNEQWARQRKMVQQAITLLFAYFEERTACLEDSRTLDCNSSVLSYLGERHELIIRRRLDDIHKSGAPDYAFDADWFDAFVETLASAAAASDTQFSGMDNELAANGKLLLEEQWRQVLMPGATYLKRFHKKE